MTIYKQNTKFLDTYKKQYYETLMEMKTDNYWKHYRKGTHIMAKTIYCLIPKKYSFNNILDVGCGSGTLVSEISKRLNIKNITAIDFSNIMLQHAKDELKYFKNVNVKELDINNNIPFESKSFDLCLSSNVIEHIKSPEQHISECLRLSKYLLLAIPIEKYNSEKHIGGHVNFFESEKICMDFLRQFNLKIINYNIKWVPVGYLYWKQKDETIYHSLLRLGKAIYFYSHPVQRWMTFFIKSTD